jgi:NAD(P)H-dependent FMN reductase
MIAKVVAIVGSYRKGGVIDSAVEAVLAGAREKGATTVTYYLTDQQLEFCTNCRQCTQEPGLERGKCRQQDDLEPMLQQIEAADAVVLGSPVNYYNVTAIFRRFMERLVVYAYWPWGQVIPKIRKNNPSKKAVLIASSAAPGFFIPLATGAPKALRLTAKSLGARAVGHMWIGLVGQQPLPKLSERTREHARQLGRKLA